MTDNESLPQVVYMVRIVVNSSHKKRIRDQLHFERNRYHFITEHISQYLNSLHPHMDSETSVMFCSESTNKTVE